MCSVARSALSLQFLAAVIALALAAPGCSGRKTDKAAVDQFFKDNPEAKRMNVGKFGGRVTIDGQPPEIKSGTRLFVLLNDPKNLQKLPPRFTAVADDGTFEFMTYLAGDGVPVGQYVVEFVQLHLPRQGGQRRTEGISRSYIGPDGLKNLYNDPERNKDNKELVVDVTDRGRTDYEFNLAVAGKDALNPGRYAATAMPGK
jgi:hypothetical protein